ncbi:MAG: hypothetical protein UT50_C0006G0013 [Candidatus Moranbacteria bacterium GW2011_GWA2_39_41]|nr:MAG: hypothetical protein UT50_C0006G0013 [Candidatus Moranbacteria bacterium GW2011_GWA2_39_41]
MTEQNEVKPNKFLKITKTIIIVLVALAFLTAGYFAYRLSQKDLFGWRLNFSLNKVETNDYQSIAPTVAFKYPKFFELDLDKDKKYGAGYVVGMKLKTDDRTGCDIRRGGPQLDLSKSVSTITEEITGPIKTKASDFQLLESGKTSVGGRPAFQVFFSFLDPIGARVRLDQIFVPEKENYMIICGTGEYQYIFFRKDFQIFYDSISFDGKILDQRTWWQKLMFWKK